MLIFLSFARASICLLFVVSELGKDKGKIFGKAGYGDRLSRFKTDSLGERIYRLFLFPLLLSALLPCSSHLTTQIGLFLFTILLHLYLRLHQTLAPSRFLSEFYQT